MLAGSLGWLTPAAADADLDAELDAAWGGAGKVTTKTVESPQRQFEARLKLIEAQRDAGFARCRSPSQSGGALYCRNHVKEEYRKMRRALEQEFAGRIEDADVSRNQSRGFGRR